MNPYATFAEHKAAAGRPQRQPAAPSFAHEDYGWHHVDYSTHSHEPDKLVSQGAVMGVAGDIIRGAGSIPLQVWDSSKDAREDNWLDQLMQCPSGPGELPGQQSTGPSRSQLHEWATQSVLIHGNALMWGVPVGADRDIATGRQISAAPRRHSVRWISRAQTKIQPDVTGRSPGGVKSYDVRWTEEQKPPTKYDPQDIMHLRWPIVEDARPWIGISPLVSALVVLDLDGQIVEHNTRLVRSGRIGGVVSGGAGTEGWSPAEGTRKLSAAINASGPGGPIWLPGEHRFVPMPLTPKEVDFRGTCEFVLSRVLYALGVPPHLWLSASATFSNVGETNRYVTEHVILPLAWKIAEGYQRWLHQDDIDAGLRVTLDLSGVDCLRGDALKRAQAVETLVRAGIPREQAAAQNHVEFDPGEIVEREQRVFIASSLRELGPDPLEDQPQGFAAPPETTTEQEDDEDDPASNP